MVFSLKYWSSKPITSSLFGSRSTFSNTVLATALSYAAIASSTIRISAAYKVKNDGAHPTLANLTKPINFHSNCIIAFFVPIGVIKASVPFSIWYDSRSSFGSRSTSVSPLPLSFLLYDA